MKKILLFVIISAGTLRADIINVPGQYSTIQAAINASSNGDTVLVEPGTYFENIIFRGRRIVLTSRFYINSDYSFITSTIINGSNPANPDSASCVRIHNGEDSTTVLQGFTVTGGTGTKWFDEHGAGRYTEGGGILIALCHPVIQFNIIENNECIDAPPGIASTGGGGIRLGDGHPLVRNNIIRNNRAMYGGGLVSNHSTFTMHNNLVYNNSEFQAVEGKPCYGGGGIWINGGGEACLITNNTIINNSADGTSGPFSGRGGGVELRPVVVNFRNNLVWGNTQRVGAQVNSSGGSSYIIAYNDIEGGYTGPGTLISNINVQPLFDSTNYYITSLSPCVDAGDTGMAYYDPPDPANPSLAEFPAKGTRRNDIGSYGGPGSRILANTVAGIHDPEGAIPREFELNQNYPNPFNPSTLISYRLPVTGDVKLSVCDLLGKEVAILVNESQAAGNYSVEWNAMNFGSGVYFYRLQAQNFSEARQMLFLK